MAFLRPTPTTTCGAAISCRSRRSSDSITAGRRSSGPRITTGLEIDLVTHDARKFFGLLLKKNGYVLEQLYSPLVVHETPEHEELKTIAHGCITRHHNHHYRGFAETQWRLFEKERPPRVKPLLVRLPSAVDGHPPDADGRGRGEPRASQRGRPALARRRPDRPQAGGAGGIRPRRWRMEFHRREYERLQGELEEAHSVSSLPETPTAKSALNDLLVRLRLRTVDGSQP